MSNHKEMATGCDCSKKISVFEYYTERCKREGKVEGICILCNVKIKGKEGVTSNFVTHLKVRIRIYKTN